ncbi:metallo-beta-lactamase domain-containing protein 1-like [Corticium candelabrum]|uniref:metallo-beta-lactamase domain-containing protein 1-like n=1 Tax=Corticium candelabrum TaxID=121492 RepID=UPI002E25C37C|nr:metallo-beta-lactamase domain-containing protein 1-like [Corticium candelabrum]
MFRDVERELKTELASALNVKLISGNDWRRLACKMGYQTRETEELQRAVNPTEDLFADWQTKRHSTVEHLMKLFDEIERHDLQQILEKSSLYHQQPAVDSPSDCPSFILPTIPQHQLPISPFSRRNVQPTPTYFVHPLIEGFSYPTGPSKQKATGSSTLFKGLMNVVVDTGTPWDKEKICAGLHENGIRPQDVNLVVCTHGHSDHVGNLNLFENATMIVSYDISRGHEYTTFPFKNDMTYKVDDYVDIIPTPGHTDCCVSVVVRDTDFGTVVAAGDLFECKDDLVQPKLWQDFSEHPDLQVRNRDKVWRIADWIVPGHGKMFRTSPL